LPTPRCAEVYVRGHCEDMCERWEECAPVPESFGTCDVDECVDFRLQTPLDPCLAPKVEIFRCYVERETYDEYFGGGVPGAPGTVCYEFVTLALDRLEEHADEIASNATQGSE
jgi:hypothetical protein